MNHGSTATAGKAAHENSGARTTKRSMWAPRVWLGMSFRGWWRLLAANRFDISPRRLHFAFGNSVGSLFNGPLGMLQEWIHGRKIRAMDFPDDPIFIIGHWRTGTTLLHELLIRDPRHTYATSYDCFAPNHTLITAWIVPRTVWWLLPKNRPMDNMPMAWDSPQEDEFAICNMGLGSPYLTIAFPNRAPQGQEFLDFRDVPEHVAESWKDRFRRFVNMITLRDKKRIVLKSPTHTARLRVLLEMFPRAKFVHIVRDPYTVFPSTMHLWRSVYQTDGLQVPDFDNLREHVFETFTRLYAELDATRPLVPEENFFELRYEDLIADPVGKMAAIYESLDLGDFELARPGVEAYCRETRNYKKNRYEMDPETRAEITERWGEQIRRYGYATEPVSATAGE